MNIRSRTRSEMDHLLLRVSTALESRSGSLLARGRWISVERWLSFNIDRVFPRSFVGDGMPWEIVEIKGSRDEMRASLMEVFAKFKSNSPL